MLFQGRGKWIQKIRGLGRIGQGEISWQGKGGAATYACSPFAVPTAKPAELQLLNQTRPFTEGSQSITLLRVSTSKMLMIVSGL
jgi:hypothetical protein